ncbi:winged helix-turn-helix transcriptional regulator [Candidatus Woesearchaeota archaeon]|nr:winged helix-turn-helix transcriptional regulator [Candidatus Woesearchaeota archaeon]HIH38320.1 winged helix-turn-helix transcriptional regulator [Candidatus Woesearchaeota archaeon]HIH48458.1 winged helix-turn-helix transcriptional regulator [Candidatus Woesearchaeota archaeon]HIJ03288.1 winged helix-turn-helix transcriptional regulator [Candidatus Woesearchaeota archaeon]
MQIEKKASFYKALGDPVRLKILAYLLKQDECTCICELAKVCRKDQSVIYRHAQLLKTAGIINTKKDGPFLFCCIKDKKALIKLLEE